MTSWICKKYEKLKLNIKIKLVVIENNYPEFYENVYFIAPYVARIIICIIYAICCYRLNYFLANRFFSHWHDDIFNIITQHYIDENNRDLAKKYLAIKNDMRHRDTLTFYMPLMPYGFLWFYIDRYLKRVLFPPKK